MANIQFVKPTLKMIKAIAADMRQADVDEIWASSHHTPIESLMAGWRLSGYSVIIMVNSIPSVMMGLVERDLLSGHGVPWLLGTDNSLKYAREFLRLSPPVIDEMLTICPRLCNMVHDKNTDSIRWLQWLGFTIDEPVPHGPDDELFHKFHLERGQQHV